MASRGYIITSKRKGNGKVVQVTIDGPGAKDEDLRIHKDDALRLMMILRSAFKEGERAQSKAIIACLNRPIFKHDDHAGSEDGETIRKLQEEVSNLRSMLHRRVEKMLEGVTDPKGISTP